MDSEGVGGSSARKQTNDALYLCVRGMQTHFLLLTIQKILLGLIELCIETLVVIFQYLQLMILESQKMN
jgi:hypothetical protein